MSFPDGASSLVETPLAIPTEDLQKTSFNMMIFTGKGALIEQRTHVGPLAEALEAARPYLLEVVERFRNKCSDGGGWTPVNEWYVDVVYVVRTRMERFGVSPISKSL